MPLSSALQQGVSATQSDAALVRVPGADVGAAIKDELSSLDPAHGALTPTELIELKALYQGGSVLPLWTDAAGRAHSSAADALILLRSAPGEGLDPADYCHDQLDRLAAALQTESPPSIRDLASFDIALSTVVLRYLHHVHSGGRVDPATIGLRLNVPPITDFGALFPVCSCVIIGSSRPSMDEAAARTYSALRIPMLIRYDRSLAADPARDTMPPVAAAVHPERDMQALTRSTVC
jgi:hypothetical protein